MASTMSHGNPYTHEEHERVCVSQEDFGGSAHMPSCQFCGSEPRRLYQYDRTKHYFCNLGCWRAYNGR